MRKTGIVRRLDDLGRVVVPKELRRVLHIQPGDPLEIYTGDHYVMLRKQPDTNPFLTQSELYARAMAGQGCAVLICDLETVVAAAGPLTKKYAGRPLSEALREYLAGGGEAGVPEQSIQPLESSGETALALAPIRRGGAAMGCVVLLMRENRVEADEGDIAVLTAAALYLEQCCQDPATTAPRARH